MPFDWNQTGLFDAPQSGPIVNRSADLSGCGRYRYHLSRSWASGPTALFVMLNPSTADALDDDATIRRCVSFARTWGAGRLEVVNLFAWRATDPKELADVADPVGPENDRWIVSRARTAQWVIAAWGVHGELGGRDAQVRQLLRERAVHHFGLTKHGHPKHPLRLPKTTTPILWSSAGAL